MVHAHVQAMPNPVADKEMIKNMAVSIAEEMATIIYYRMLLLKYLPEVKAVEAGKIKAVRGKEVFKLFESIANSN